ncbi:MAG: hypothetical protein ACLR0U_00915 [Enterocloster clostridioformis]
MNAVTGYLSRFQTQSSVQGSKEPGNGGGKDYRAEGGHYAV